MSRFYYVARDKKGKKINDYEDGTTIEEVIAKLQAKDLYVVNIMPEVKEKKKTGKQVEGASGKKFKVLHFGVNSEDLALFCRQLATLLGAGVTILKSLDIISKQVSSKKLYLVLKDLQRHMEAGLSLHEAMAKHTEVFSELWVNLAESGEASGNLAVVLTRLATYLERNAAFRSKIISALMYPMILVVAGFGALIFMTVRIIPVFADLFTGFNVKLPALTQGLIVVSTFIRKYIFIAAGGGLVLFILFKKYTSTKSGRLQYERFKFKIPVFGDFYSALIVERFSSEMSTLIESGVPILYSLEITEQSVGNLVMAGIIHDIKEGVRQGKSLSQPLETSGFFEPMVVQMVTIGEEIGELSQMFKKINTFYQEQVETFLVRFTSMFEPIMLVFMGVVIGIMVIGMFLPIFQIATIGGS